MYTLKQGTALYMSGEIEKILSVICPIFKSFHLPVVITSGLDGPHRNGSLHGKFRAIDIRKVFQDSGMSACWAIQGQTILEISRERFRIEKYPVKVLDEVDHIHIEWNGA